MRTKVVTITLLCLILLASIGWPAAIAQSAQEAAETREQRGDPEPLYLPKTMRPGFYAARDNRNLPASEYHLVGGHQSFRWDRLEPTEDNYQWQYIDDFINAQLAAGKQAVGIGIVTYGGRAEGGNAVPSWVFAQKGARKIVCSGGHEIPRYWDAVYLREYEDFIADLAARYDNDPRVEFVQIGVGLYMETQPSQGSSDDACVEAAMQADGKTRWSWPYMVNDIIDIYRRHFQNTTLLLLSEPTFYNIEADRQKWMDHAVHNGVGLQPAGLHADREWVDLRKKTSGGNSWHGFGKYDYMLDQAEENAFMTWNPVPMAHEAYDYMFGGRTDQGALPDERQFFWGIAAGLSRKVDYITIERNALYVGQPNDPTVTPIASHLRFMEWASQYMGKYVTTVNSKDGRTYERTPSVWVLLRESAYPSNLYPQEGNYSFWLLQDDNVSGGRTKVVTYRRESELDIIGNMTGGSLATRPEIITVDDDPSLSVLQNRDPDDPMDTSPSYKGWICRRTDQATGNRRMYFKIDDRYYYGGPTQATITITYFDRGTDSWKLVGHDASGTEVTLRTITKGNTNHWETVEIGVPAGYFSNMLLGSADFYIDSMGDGDEYVHMVDFRTGAGSGDTHSINLSASNGGWNLISFRVRPSSTAIADVLSSIAGKYDIVQAWVNGAWASYIPGVGGALTNLGETMGFWIKVNQNCTLVVSGQAPTSTTIHLSAANGGWNLIGWPSDDARSIQTALAGISGAFDVVYAYHAFDTADPWKIYSPITPAYANDLTQTASGDGMWIHVTSDVDLVVAY